MEPGLLQWFPTKKSNYKEGLPLEYCVVLLCSSHKQMEQSITRVKR